VLLIVQQTTQIIEKTEKTNKNKPFYSVKTILQNHWDDYLKTHEIRNIEKQEVEKMLSCKKLERGCFVYFCFSCLSYILMLFGCNSRLCSCCGKRYTDEWANKLSKKVLPKTEHRHLVFSVPDIIWFVVRKNRNLQKVLMDATTKTIKKCFRKTLKKDLEIGIICVLHPFGRDLIFKPHVHVVVTNGGFTKDNKFVKLKYISYDMLHKKWQYYLLIELKKHVSKKIIDYCFNKYPNGFAAYIKPEIIYSGKHLAQYIGRYLRHPAIADSRIIFYDKKIVRFCYLDHKVKKRVVSEMSVMEFISAIIQHIPDKNFKMIRYYGLYSRKGKKKVKIVCKQSSLKQFIWVSEVKKEVFDCPYCNARLKFVAYLKKPPDNLLKMIREL